MLESERVIDPPDVAFARVKDLFDFPNYEEYPSVAIGSVVRRKELWNFDVEGELWGEIGRKLEVRIIPKWKSEPALSFSLEPLRGVTELKINYPMAVEIEEHSFPVQISPIEINEETGKQLAGVLVDWLERTFRTGEIDPSYSGTPTVSVKNLEV